VGDIVGSGGTLTARALAAATCRNRIHRTILHVGESNRLNLCAVRATRARSRYRYDPGFHRFRPRRSDAIILPIRSEMVARSRFALWRTSGTTRTTKGTLIGSGVPHPRMRVTFSVLEAPCLRGSVSGGDSRAGSRPDAADRLRCRLAPAAPAVRRRLRERLDRSLDAPPPRSRGRPAPADESPLARR